jgi:peptidoglycan/xylan/chitin deacetylase (PgdA/CDA1 family)
MRAWKLFRAFGLTTTRYDRLLRRYESILHSHSVPATLPVTAVTLRRHPRIMRRLADSGIELAVHGLTHVDHSTLDLEGQTDGMIEARRIFRDAGFSPEGFRCPYLWWNEDTPLAAHRAGFTYVSNQVYLWKDFDQGPIRRLYRVRPKPPEVSLPFTRRGVVEIPVALPDDFLLAEFLALPAEEIAVIWSRMLEDIIRKGELLVLQVHPELVSRCGEALDRLLRRARAEGGIWIATMANLARWWRARREFQATAEIEHGEIKITVQAPPQAVVGIHNLPRSDPRSSGESWLRLRGETHLIPGLVMPFVAVPPKAAEEHVLALEERGYVCRRSHEPAKYAAHLTAGQLGDGGIDDWIRRITATDHPLLRLLPWPEGKRAALCITGDIDCVTLRDYAWRLARK